MLFYEIIQTNSMCLIVYMYLVVAVSRTALSEVVPFSCAHAGAVSEHDM